MGRKILLVTTDQQRHDTLGCYGGALARTPVVDALAADGIRYDRAVPQSVVCMPSRSTILTGQHPSTHGVWMNGVPLPVDAPSIAAVLHDAGYRTALVGKPHFQPFLDPFGRFTENALGTTTTPPDGTHRGFEHLELATHGPFGPLHYARWLGAEHPEAVGGFYTVLDHQLQVSAAGGGETDAPQVKVNPIERGWYHTDWVADRTIAWLDGLAADDDWFCWMSFPDPHHPWDPPQSEVGRVDWREVPLPAGYPEQASERERILDDKPRHWRLWYDGELVSNYEAPAEWVPATLTADQVREVNARNAVECELIDEALGRVLAAAGARGWGDDLDVVFTTDHGELQGDFGLLFKGPYHVDGLMRLPLVWRPAPSAAVAPAVVSTPVGLVDLAGTFCEIAALAVPPWVQGTTLPVADGAGGPERVLTEWDSELFGVAVHLRTITRDGWVCTAYRPGTVHDGSEGELYDLADDPLQQANRWADPACRAQRDDLLTDLWASQPPAHEPLGWISKHPSDRRVRVTKENLVTDLILDSLQRRMRAMHSLYYQAVDTMGPAEVNHFERAGVLPIAFSLFHYTNMEDASFLMITGEPPIWDAAWQDKVQVAIDDHGKHRTVDEMEHQRIGDYDAFKDYQRAVFDRTEAWLDQLDPARLTDVLITRPFPELVASTYSARVAGPAGITVLDATECWLYQHGLRHMGEIELARGLVGLGGMTS